MDPSVHIASDFSFLAEVKEKALRLLGKTSLPSSAEESWRKIRLEGRADLSPFPSANSLSKISAETKDSSIRCLSFQEALKERHLKEILETHLKKSLREASETCDYFALQNLAEEKQSLFLFPERGTEAKSEKRIRIKHKLQGGNSIIHKLFVYVPDNTELRLIEEFGGEAKTKKEPLYFNTSTTVHLGRNSTLRYFTSRDYDSEDCHFQRFLCEQKRDSRLFYGLAHCGGGLGKGFVESRLLEANAEFRGVGIYAGSAKEFHDIEMLVEHRYRHTHSSLLYKAIVRERAHSVFDGKLTIVPDIKDASSRQINHNLLLDSQARAESMPRLIVKADDVSCEHGATVGMLDPEALFYLLSRGLEAEKARYLMIEGFLNEAAREFPLETEQAEGLLDLFKKKLDMI